MYQRWHWQSMRHRRCQMLRRQAWCKLVGGVHGLFCVRAGMHACMTDGGVVQKCERRAAQSTLRTWPFKRSLMLASRALPAELVTRVARPSPSRKGCSRRRPPCRSFGVSAAAISLPSSSGAALTATTSIAATSRALAAPDSKLPPRMVV